MSATKVNNFGSIVNLVYSTCVCYGKGSDLLLSKVIGNTYEFHNVTMKFVPTEDEDKTLVLHLDFTDDKSHYEIPMDGTASVKIGNFKATHGYLKTERFNGITLTFAWGDNELSIDRSGRRVEKNSVPTQEETKDTENV